MQDQIRSAAAAAIVFMVSLQRCLASGVDLAARHRQKAL
jgi:hypothetical protein